MSYLPLARKYRPQTFEELIGQPHVTTTLTRALESKRVVQAYLFTGSRGVGKTSAARILAKCLNCAEGPTARPCNRCASCTEIAQGSSLDVLEIDGASNRGIDEVRGLREMVPFAPASGSFRVYIIDEVHMLTPEAFNALLKTLEEPPAHVKFIFATTAVHKVPPTILSRCQRFDFRRIEVATIVEVLTRLAEAERWRIDEAALYDVARAAEGSLRDAEVILEQLASFSGGAIAEADVTALLGAVEPEALLAGTQAILDRDVPKALAFLLGQFEQGKEAPQLLAGLLRHLRNLLMLGSTAGAPARDVLGARLVDEPADRLQRLEEQARRVPVQELLLMLQILAGAYELVRRSPMAHTILELAVIKLATRAQWRSLEDISRQIERLNDRAGAAPPPAAPAPSQRLQEPVPGVITPSEPASLADQPTARPMETSGAAGTSEAPMSGSPDLAAVWTVFLERLAAQKMSLAAYLAEARPLRLEGDSLTIGLPGFALHQEVLNVTEHRRMIDRLLSELCHASVTVRYETLPATAASEQGASAPPNEPSLPPIVQDIVNLFNATVLDQPRTAP